MSWGNCRPSVARRGAMALIENRPFGQRNVGDSARLLRRLSETDITLFALMFGDVNPAHVDDGYAIRTIFHRVIAHGVWIGALKSTVLGTMLPGRGTLYLAQSLRFLHPVGLGGTVGVTAAVEELHAEQHRCILACAAVPQERQKRVSGIAEVIPPPQKVSRPSMELLAVKLLPRRLDDHA